jgi:hypothetical protein
MILCFNGTSCEQDNVKTQVVQLRSRGVKHLFRFHTMDCVL